MTKCLMCGYILEEEDIFCPECGEKKVLQAAKIDAVSLSESQVDSDVNRVPESSTFKKMAFILGILGSLVLFISGLNMIQLQSVSGDSVAEAFYQLIGWSFIGLSCLSIMLTLYVNCRIE